MTDYIFSKKDNAFYPLSLREDYVKAKSWPDDGIKVSEDVFVEYSQVPPEGKLRGVDKKGNPVWVDKPSATEEELREIAEIEKKYLISAANERMNSHQLPGKAALNRLTESEKKDYGLWLDYLDKLIALNVADVNNIQWPEAPEE